MTLSPAAEKRLRAEMWRRGELDIYLDENQVKLYQDIRESEGTYVLEIARRVGKSHLLMCLATEECLRNPGARVVYLAQTQKAAREVSKKLFLPFVNGAPDDLRPTFAGLESSWEFPNGAHIDMGGAEDEAQIDRLRGGAASLVIVDEAGFTRHLKYALLDVLMPLTMTTGGRVLIASTPPKSPGHYFIQVADSAAAVGKYAHRTIYDNPRLTPAQIEQYIAESAMTSGLTVADFKKTTTYKREYLAMRVTDAESAVIREWPDAQEACVTEHPRPGKFKPCIVVDPGFQRDLTGGVAGYYDFLEAVLVVEDEFALRRASTSQIGDALKELEARLYPNFRPDRFLDDPGRMSADLYESHRLSCSPVLNKNREADIANARAMVSQRRVRIHPRCKTLLRQLNNAVYASNGVDWERNEVDGHQDVLAAFVYFCRLVSRANPYPPGWGLTDVENQLLHGSQQQSEPLGRQFLKFSATGRLLSRGLKQ